MEKLFHSTQTVYTFAMKRWKQLIVSQLAAKGIFVYRKNHPNDFTLAQRIHSRLISEAKGVLHIGAHYGQEAAFYAELSSRVLWIEAAPESFARLRQSIKRFPDQVALLELLGDRDEVGVEFFVSSNDGASSSVFQFADDEHEQMGIRMIDSLNLSMKRLDSVLSWDDAALYPHWVIDVQGSELAVLKGAGELLTLCQSVYIETKMSSHYKHGAGWIELRDFLIGSGFLNLWEVDSQSEENIFFVRRHEGQRSRL